MKKRKHHYVWRYYLEPWTRTGSIFCLRDGNVFPSALKGVANKRDFYKAERLTPAELDAVRKLAIYPAPQHLQKLNEGWLETLAIPFKYVDLVQGVHSDSSDTHELITEAIHNIEEDLHAHIERSAIKYLDALRRQDASFCDSDTDMLDFLYFICIQYLRTSGAQQSVVTAVANRLGGLRFDRMWKVLRHLFATNIAWTLYAERHHRCLIFLKNASSRPFLTADEPLVNICAMERSVEDQVEELEFYYPMSPRLAILLSRRTDLANGESIDLCFEQVDCYNRYIVHSSYEQVYADTREILEQVVAGLYR